MLSPLYLAEISPPEVRGSLMALEQLAIVSGVVLGFWTGFFTRDCMYTSLFASSAIFIIAVSTRRDIMEITAGDSTNSSGRSCLWLSLSPAVSASSHISRKK